MKFLDQLQNPPREFTAIPFWFLNGDLTAEELRRQLADFAAHGIYGVVLHPRMGLSPDITYLGERYFAHIRTAVEAAAALDMKIVLYDEGMYPSGSACGLVVKDHPELASEGITLTQTVLPEDELLAQAESGTLVVRKSGGTMRGLHWGEDDGEKNAPKTADILNPAAVSRFIELTHEAYYRELKEYFGTTIIGFFTDEPSILGRNVSGMFPWTHGFAEIFRRAGGNAANVQPDDMIFFFLKAADCIVAVYQHSKGGRLHSADIQCFMVEDREKAGRVNANEPIGLCSAKRGLIEVVIAAPVFEV